MVKEAKADIDITTTTNLKNSLEGTTFVLTNFRPGGLEGLRLDEEIPTKYNILGQETSGPGGTFFALRSIPQVLNLCHAIEDVCPDAYMINYVNPTNFVMDAVRRESHIKCFAICDAGGNELYYSLPELIGGQVGEIRPRAAGVNHHTWLMELRVRNEDGYPILIEQLKKCLRESKSEKKSGFRFARARKYYEFEIELIEKFGIAPANSYYLYPYFHHDDALADHRTCTERPSLYKMFMVDRPVHQKNFEAMAKGEIPIYMDPTKHHTNVGHGDMAVRMILAISNNEETEFHVNVPNKGFITNLPMESIVEVPCLIDSRGVRPLCMGKLPKCIIGLTYSLIVWEELTVDAALSGDRNLVIQALLAHPRWPLSIDDAEKMCDDMLKAHAPYLPQFKY